MSLSAPEGDAPTQPGARHRLQQHCCITSRLSATPQRAYYSLLTLARPCLASICCRRLGRRFEGHWARRPLTGGASPEWQ